MITVQDVAMAETHTVLIEGMKYIPEKLSVRLGDKVKWVNKDFFPHTVTAMDKSFDSRNIAIGKSWVLTAKAKGRFQYKCSLHKPMIGELLID